MAAQLVSATGAGITVEMIGPETAQTLGTSRCVT